MCCIVDNRHTEYLRKYKGRNRRFYKILKVLGTFQNNPLRTSYMHFPVVLGEWLEAKMDVGVEYDQCLPRGIHTYFPCPPSRLEDNLIYIEVTTYKKYLICAGSSSSISKTFEAVYEKVYVPKHPRIAWYGAEAQRVLSFPQFAEIGKQLGIPPWRK